MVRYAEKYNLNYDKENKVLTAFRNHDRRGCGIFNNTIQYQSGKYYKDWHCDLDSTEENSFDLGIWPEGNTKVLVKVEDWGTAIPTDEDGKARVWGFTVL